VNGHSTVATLKDGDIEATLLLAFQVRLAYTTVRQRTDIKSRRDRDSKPIEPRKRS